MNFGSLGYKQLKEIKVGDTLFDCSGGINIEFSVIDSPVEIFNKSLESNQLTWKGIDHNGKKMNFLVTEKLTHYGPRIYMRPAYTQHEDFLDGVPKSNE